MFTAQINTCPSVKPCYQGLQKKLPPPNSKSPDTLGFRSITLFFPSSFFLMRRSSLVSPGLTLRLRGLTLQLAGLSLVMLGISLFVVMNTPKLAGMSLTIAGMSLVTLGIFLFVAVNTLEFAGTSLRLTGITLKWAGSSLLKSCLNLFIISQRILIFHENSIIYHY